MLDIPCDLSPAQELCLSLLYRNTAFCQGHSWQFFKNLTQKDVETALWKPLNKQIDGLQTSAGPCRSVSIPRPLEFQEYLRRCAASPCVGGGGPRREALQRKSHPAGLFLRRVAFFPFSARDFAQILVFYRT